MYEANRTSLARASLTADYLPLTKLGTERNLIPEQLWGSEANRRNLDGMKLNDSGISDI